LIYHVDNLKLQNIHRLGLGKSGAMDFKNSDNRRIYENGDRLSLSDWNLSKLTICNNIVVWSDNIVVVWVF